MSTKRNRWLLLLLIAIVLVALITWLIVSLFGAESTTGEYFESFEEAGTWTVGNDANATGMVSDGLYEITVDLIGDIFWVAAGEKFTDGLFQVDARPIEGTVDNGYGMLIRVDENKGRFYVFKVSSDGYVFIGRCDDSCLETEVLVSRDWFPSEAVVQGLEVTNILKISASGPDLTFYVNEIEVGQITDEILSSGDIGLIAETFALGGVRVVFDNFQVTPIVVD